MIKTIVVAASIFLVSLGMLLPVTNRVVYASENGDAVCETLGRVSGDGCSTSVQSGSSAANIIEAALNLLSVFAGILAVVMIILAGVKYITSGGDAGKISSARNSIIFALAGIAIVALSQTIVYFVIKTFE